MNDRESKQAAILHSMWRVAYGAACADDATQRLAAGVVYTCLSQMWDNYHKKTQALTIADFIEGGLDYWITALGLPLDETKSAILKLTCQKIGGISSGTTD